MPSRVSLVPVLALALAGCAGGRGYDDAATMQLPPTADDARAERDRFAPPPPYARPEPLPTRDLPPEVAHGDGPRGTSGEVHQDDVGYARPLAVAPDARWSDVALGVAHPTLPSGTPVEVTALDTGRTIVALVVARQAGAVVALSPAAAHALGVGERAGVRVRTVAVGPQDEMALRAGQAASPRLDAPPALLAALRRKLPGPPPRTPARGPGPARTPPANPHALPAPANAPSGTFVVQVAALSSAERAAALAREVGGHVAATGTLYRVQIGPFPDQASARRARDGAARRGYGGAHILHTE